MNNEIFEFLSSRSGDTETAENSRIKEIALELSRRCSLYEEKYANSSHHVRNHNLFFPSILIPTCPYTAGFFVDQLILYSEKKYIFAICKTGIEFYYSCFTTEL